jgi:hypothetical protein
MVDLALFYDKLVSVTTKLVPFEPELLESKLIVIFLGNQDVFNNIFLCLCQIDHKNVLNLDLLCKNVKISKNNWIYVFNNLEIKIPQYPISKNTTWNILFQNKIITKSRIEKCIQCLDFLRENFDSDDEETHYNVKERDFDPLDDTYFINQGTDPCLYTDCFPNPEKFFHLPSFQESLYYVKNSNEYEEMNKDLSEGIVGSDNRFENGKICEYILQIWNHCIFNGKLDQYTQNLGIEYQQIVFKKSKFNFVYDETGSGLKPRTSSCVAQSSSELCGTNTAEIKVMKNYACKFVCKSVANHGVFGFHSIEEYELREMLKILFSEGSSLFNNINNLLIFEEKRKSTKGIEEEEL